MRGPTIPRRVWYLFELRLVVADRGESKVAQAKVDLVSGDAPLLGVPAGVARQ